MRRVRVDDVSRHVLIGLLIHRVQQPVGADHGNAPGRRVAVLIAAGRLGEQVRAVPREVRAVAAAVGAHQLPNLNPRFWLQARHANHKSRQRRQCKVLLYEDEQRDELASRMQKKVPSLVDVSVLSMPAAAIRNAQQEFAAALRLGTFLSRPPPQSSS